MKLVTNVNLNRNEIQNAVIQPLSSAPSNPKAGQIYYNSIDKFIYRYDGLTWGAVGVVYTQGATTGAVICGLSADGTVTTNNVIALTLTGYAAVEGGAVTTGMTLQQAVAALDTAIKGKQANITGAATTITSDNLIASRALVSDANGKVAVSDITATELNSLDGVDSNIQDQINTVNERIDDISAIGRFLSYWDCTTGLPTTQPASLPYTYHTGDYFVVSTVGTTNYKPDGSTYTGTASSVIETSVVRAQDIYRYDGSNWYLSEGTLPDLSGYVATFSQTFTTEQKAQARANIGAGTSSFSGSYDDLSNKPTIPSVTLNGSATTAPSFYAPTSAGISGQVLTSNGSGAPTWQSAPSAVHKYTANNPSLVSSGGAWTWSIPASTHGISNGAMFVNIYEVSTGAQVLADITVNQSNYGITISIVDTSSIGTLSAGTYKAVAVG